MTFTPRLYSQQKLLIQNEYRQENKLGGLKTDLVFLLIRIMIN